MSGVIDPREFEQRLRAIAGDPLADPESSHINADDLMCDTLQGLGYDVSAFHSMRRWYA